MHTLLIWILVNTSTAQPVLPYQFPTQTDCQRAVIALHQYAHGQQLYKCQRLKIVDPSGCGLSFENDPAHNYSHRGSQHE